MSESEDETNNKSFGDSDFLSMNDKAIRDFRSSGKHANRKIIEKMITLRHNMKYNRHLVSVYMKAKELFDTMVEEHRSQIQSLDEIYRHINHLIRENLSEQRIQSKKNTRSSSSSSTILNELYKDKKRIRALLKRMRKSYDKLTNVDTVVGVTIDNINKITFMDDDDKSGKSSDDDSEVEDDSEDEDVEVEDSKNSEHESESEEDSESSESSESSEISEDSESSEDSEDSESSESSEDSEDSESSEDIDEEAIDEEAIDDEDADEDDTKDDPEMDDEDKDIFIF